MVFNLPVTWSLCGNVPVEANSLEEAMEEFNKNSEFYKLPEKATYVDGSFELSSQDIDEMEAMLI